MHKLQDASPQGIDYLTEWLASEASISLLDPRMSPYGTDLFCVVDKEKTRLQRIFEPFSRRFSLLICKCISVMQFGLFYFKRIWHRSEESRGKDFNQMINSTADSDTVTGVITQVVSMAIGVGMLIAPIWVLYILHDPRAKLGVITGFVVAFMLMVKFSTAADPSGILAATAG